MHTILGAGGPVANALTRELQNSSTTIRLASRRPIESKDKTPAGKRLIC